MTKLSDLITKKYPEFEELVKDKKRTQTFLDEHSNEIAHNLTEEEIVDFIGGSYDATAESYNKDTHTQAIPPELNSFLGQLPKNSLVLDLGCGHGRNSKYMLEHGMQVMPYDISPRLIEITKSKIAPLINKVPAMIIGDFTTPENNPFSEEMFNGIWACTSLLIHTPLTRLDETVGYWGSTLKPNGLFAVSYFNPNHPNFKEGYNLRMSSTGEIKVFISPGREQLKRAFADAGMKLQNQKIDDYIDKPKGIREEDFFISEMYSKQ